ncbi:MAG: RBBP9/YdeN family alpha/beta hydrolase [Candidatus Pacearchaeota archaeon]
MKCIIVHGLNSCGKELVEQGRRLQNERDWIPWLKVKLEKNGYESHNPLMPKFWEPSYEKWKEKFEQFEIGENTVLVGHSLGGGFLLRYLSENKIKVKKLVLIAPSVIAPEEFPSIKGFYNFNLDKSLPERTHDMVVFYSDNDFSRINESVEYLKTRLGFRFIELKGQGHFIRKDMGTVKFPELLEEVLS